MEKIINSSKLDTPEISYNEDKNCIFIVGNSFMEHPQPFYKRMSFDIIQIIDEHIQKTKSILNISFYLEYFNTASSLSILEFLQRIENKFMHTKNVKIYWFEEGEENDEEIKPEIASIIKLPFVYVQINSDVEDFKQFVKLYLY
ncbi:MAG: SiaC family regulatory phosphoprotein [Bacteroidales bacterium]|nr:SiaC family regulatory phosphoprotein [Bacteroidales bacterium]